MLKKISLIVLLTGCGFTLAQPGEVFFNRLSERIDKTRLPAFNKARLLIQNQSYISAIPYLDTLLLAYPDETGIAFLSGLCYTHHSQKRTQSMVLIKRMETNREWVQGYYYYLGRSYEANDSMRQALFYYTKALETERTFKEQDVYYLELIQTKVKQVENQMNYRNKVSGITVRNIGKPINTNGSEYVPLIPADQSKLIFTYRGELSKGGKRVLQRQKLNTVKAPEQGQYFEDIFVAYPQTDSTWGTPVPVTELNTNLHDAAVSINGDGTRLFIYKNTGIGAGDLYISKWDGLRWRTPVYQKGLNSPAWDGSACFLPDNKHVILSSERKGGYGGRDLYIAEQLGDNLWGHVKNLGPLINSKADEDAPFVTADGAILFFATNGKRSLGGYDIMRADRNDSTWQEPFNVGAPVNTKEDDKFFSVTSDGKKAYFSSQRTDGLGEQDIYVAQPAIPGKPVALVQVGGNVTFNDKPAEASIEVRSLTKRSAFVLSALSDKKSGHFLLNIPAGDEYELIVRHKKFPPQVKEISTVAVDSFLTITIIADFYSPERNEKLGQKRDSILTSLKKGHPAAFMDEFVARYGKVKVPGLVFKVQVGAFLFFENFNYTNVLGFPKILRQIGDDGITRFTMGGFETMEEAKKLLDRVREKSLKEAFIVATYNDKRYYLQDLIKEGILK